MYRASLIDFASCTPFEVRRHDLSQLFIDQILLATASAIVPRTSRCKPILPPLPGPPADFRRLEIRPSLQYRTFGVQRSEAGFFEYPQLNAHAWASLSYSPVVAGAATATADRMAMRTPSVSFGSSCAGSNQTTSTICTIIAKISLATKYVEAVCGRHPQPAIVAPVQPNVEQREQRRRPSGAQVHVRSVDTSSGRASSTRERSRAK